MPRVGEPILLNLCLEDGAIDKYVKAVLRNVSGVEVPGSPVMLTHMGDGVYKNSSVSMPNTPAVTALYRVFDNVACTIQSILHLNAMDVFELWTYEKLAEMDMKLNILLNSLNSDLIGIVSDSECVIGTIDGSIILLGSVEDVQATIGEILDPQTIIGVIEDCCDC